MKDARHQHVTSPVATERNRTPRVGEVQETAIATKTEFSMVAPCELLRPGAEDINCFFLKRQPIEVREMLRNSVRGFIRALRTQALPAATKGTPACFPQSFVGIHGSEHTNMLFKGPGLFNTMPGVRNLIVAGSHPGDKDGDHEKNHSQGKGGASPNNSAPLQQKPSLAVARALPREYSELSNEVIMPSSDLSYFFQYG
jgi:hypothetical protein